MNETKYLWNAWYVAAWSDEVGRALLARTILEQPVLLFRKESGDAVAIGNACPHRHAPLNMGKLLGDVVECPYHGLRFDGSGACVLNPHGQGMIPPKMKTPGYPLVERHKMIWIWMGDPEKADTANIPDFSCHEDPAMAFVGGLIEMKAHYELITDNLLDLAHAEFVHEGILSSKGLTKSRLDTIQQGSTIYSNRWVPDGDAIPAFAMMYEKYKPEQNVDQWAYMRWDAPAHMLLDTGITMLGGTRREGVWIYGTDILTPKDATTTYYFWGITRSYLIDQEAAGDQWRANIKAAFEGQDKIVIEAQQRMLGTRSLEEVDAVMFASDVAAQRARRLLATMIKNDERSTPQNPALHEQRQRSEPSCSPVLPAL